MIHTRTDLDGLYERTAYSGRVLDPRKSHLEHLLEKIASVGPFPGFYVWAYPGLDDIQVKAAHSQGEAVDNLNAALLPVIEAEVDRRFKVFQAGEAADRDRQAKLDKIQEGLVSRRIDQGAVPQGVHAALGNRSLWKLLDGEANK